MVQDLAYLAEALHLGGQTLCFTIFGLHIFGAFRRVLRALRKALNKQKLPITLQAQVVTHGGPMFVIHGRHGFDN